MPVPSAKMKKTVFQDKIQKTIDFLLEMRYNKKNLFACTPPCAAQGVPQAEFPRPACASCSKKIPVIVHLYKINGFIGIFIDSSGNGWYNSIIHLNHNIQIMINF